MNNIPTYSAEISLYFDDDFGLRVECPEKFLRGVIAALSNAGFKCGKASIDVAGTANISNWVAFPVEGSNVSGAQAALESWLKSTGTEFVEDVQMALGEKHIKYNLITHSVFDKKA